MTSSLQSLYEIGKMIGVDVNQLRRESRRGGFPKARRAKGKPVFDAAEVQRWRTLNIRTKPRAGDQPKVPAIASDDPDVCVLMAGRAGGLQLARSAVAVASRRLGMAAAAGNVGSGTMDDLRRALQELRLAEDGYIDLGVKRGELIPVEKAASVAARASYMFVRSLDLLENSIAIEFAQWLADPAIRGMSGDDLSRKVRAYIHQAHNEARQRLADDFREQAAADELAEERDNEGSKP
jgi:hypothetical protein